MCHRLCDVSTYGLKAHVRETSTPPKLTIGHGQPFYFPASCLHCFPLHGMFTVCLVVILKDMSTSQIVDSTRLRLCRFKDVGLDLSESDLAETMC